MDPTRIPLTRLSPELTALAGQPAPDYRRLYMSVLNGRLPHMTQDDNGRYYTQREHLPAIAAALGIARPPNRQVCHAGDGIALASASA